MTIVLDTNVVLDWLLFRDPACGTLGGAFAAGRIRWVASEPMRAELARVLARAHFEAWASRRADLWPKVNATCETVAARALAGDALRLRCSDPDDQMFIDLALSHGARWLLSRDRAVLKLARRAQPLGLAILTPNAWSALLGPACA